MPTLKHPVAISCCCANAWPSAPWLTCSGAPATQRPLSFWSRATLVGMYSGCLRTADQGRSYTFSYTIASSNVWQQLIVPISGDTGGTWTNTDVTATTLYLDFTLMDGGGYRTVDLLKWQPYGCLGVTGGLYTFAPVANNTFA